MVSSCTGGRVPAPILACPSGSDPWLPNPLRGRHCATLPRRRRLLAHPAGLVHRHLSGHPGGLELGDPGAGGQRFYRADPDPDRVGRRGSSCGRPATAVWWGGATGQDRLGEAFLQLDPTGDTSRRKMVPGARPAWPSPRKRRAAGCGFYVHDYDLPRRRLLRQRGYSEQAEWGDGAPPAPRGAAPAGPSLPAGYRLRGDAPRPGRRPGDRRPAQRRLRAHVPYRRRVPRLHATALLRRDLDLVAEAPAACSPATWGSPRTRHNRRGIFEPGLHSPEHRRRGLALAVMREGLAPAARLGAADAYVESSSGEPATPVRRGRLFRGLPGALLEEVPARLSGGRPPSLGGR